MTRGIGVAVIAAGALVASRAAADEAAKPEDLELRLTLSTFLYRESGADAPPIVDQGAALGNASPIRRTFGDLRAELRAGGFTLDARIRQTTSERYQAGASAGGEYELRVLDQELGSHTTFVTIGRQVIDAVGATRIDGLALTHRMSDTVRATLFAGAFPQLGSRSLETDYARIRRADGNGVVTDGPHLVPITGGLGAAYQTPDYHGDLGGAAVFAPQDVPGASASDKARVFTTSSGYWRPAAGLDLYHFALLDLVGGVHLTNGSAGIDARPIANLQLSASVHHVSVDLLQIAARGVLDDPDPSAIGVVQNNLALLRISQDAARGAVSLAFAQQRFELSASGGVHRRPRVDIALADGSGARAFREARSAEATFAILDRRSIAGLRLQLSGSLTFPVGSGATDRARGSLVRLAASRGFAQQRGQLEADVMAERFRDDGAGHCMTSLDPSRCYGNAKTTAAQAGALASWRIGREWLVIADLHAGVRDVRSAGIAGPIAWPVVTSITSFVRVQWRYR